MANKYVEKIINDLETKFGQINRLVPSLSLFEIPSIKTRVYFRYSKLFKLPNKYNCFYGLREEDLKKLEGQNSYICFVWNKEDSPILIPYYIYEEIFSNLKPMSDGQFKVHLFFGSTGTEFYIANVGKFNVDAYYGLKQLDRISIGTKIPELSHSQVQSLMGSIGSIKGFNIWIPLKDRGNLDYSIVKKFNIERELPPEYSKIYYILGEIDVTWMEKNKISRLFEIEHTTPIYSALLRFNDIYLSISEVNKFGIISNKERKNKFVKEINRPTFTYSQLADKVSFMEYGDVFLWYNRLTNKL